MYTPPNVISEAKKSQEGDNLLKTPPFLKLFLVGTYNLFLIGNNLRLFLFIKDKKAVL